MGIKGGYRRVERRGAAFVFAVGRCPLHPHKELCSLTSVFRLTAEIATAHLCLAMTSRGALRNRVVSK